MRRDRHRRREQRPGDIARWIVQVLLSLAFLGARFVRGLEVT